MSKHKHGKKYRNAAKVLDLGKKYSLDDGLSILEQVAFAKFDETVDVAFNLGVDPKHADQMVRGAVSLPHGIGKKIKILVFAKGEKAKEAEASGADFIGSDDLVEKILGGWSDFDKALATPDMMVAVSKVARILGPRGLMPNPKLGTVTMDISKAIQEQKQGVVEYRTEKTGIIHVTVGRKSFGKQKLRENFLALLSVILKAKPQTSKGAYLRGVTISTTMSPGIRLDAVALSQSN